MTFPKNNLPSDSRYWAREVEKKLTNLENSFRSSEINNTTRDSQLSVTANSALTAAQSANAAIGAVVSLGDSGSAYGINADNISAGSITSSDFYTANAQTGRGIHISTSENAIKFNNDSNNALGWITSRPGLNFAGGGVQINYGTSVGAYPSIEVTQDGITVLGAFNRGFNTDDTSNTILGPTSCNNTFSASGALTAFSGLLTNSIAPATGSGPLNITGGLQVGTINSTGAVTLSSTFSTSSTIQRTQLIGGGTTLAQFNNDGQLQRDSSSARYKTNIDNLQIDYDSLLSLEPRQYRLKEEVESNPENAKTYAGFIAEELDDAGLGIFVSYSKDEEGNARPEGVQYHHLTSALLFAIKKQDKTIKSLEARIEALESR